MPCLDGGVPPPLYVALPANAHFLRLTMSFWILVVALLIIGLVLFHRHRRCSRNGIVPHAGHLPADLHSWLAAGNLETIVGYFFCDIDRGKAPDAGQLIPKIFVEGLEPL